MELREARQLVDSRIESAAEATAALRQLLERLTLCEEQERREKALAEYEERMAALEGGMAIYMGLGPIHSLSMAFGDSPLHHGTLVTDSMPAIMSFYDGRGNSNLDLSLRNLRNVHLVNSKNASTYDLIDCEVLIIDQDSVNILSESLKD